VIGDYTLLSINTPGIRAHETVAGTKNAGAYMYKKKIGDYTLLSINTPGILAHENVGAYKKSTTRVGICKRSFLRHNNILK